MIVGFVIWSLVSAFLLGIGISAWRAKSPVGFFTGVKPPRVGDVKRYNHAVAALWFVYAALMELCGAPLLFLEQNSLGFIPMMLGAVAITIAMVALYLRIERKYRLP